MTAEHRNVAQVDHADWQGRRLSLMAWIAWSLAFGLAYSQAPLFTSNENQYFLHGLARAGYGLLGSDWLASTVDPTPVFSLLVEIMYRLLPLAVFYLWALLLFGVYLFALDGLASDLFHLRDDPIKHRVFLALLVAAHAALLRFILQRTLGDAWGFTLEGGLAGQRILGNVLEPSMFGVLLLLSIYLFHRKRIALSVVSAVAAATIHPTYLLSAGLLTVAYALAAFMDHERKRAIGILALALILVVPILVYVSSNFTTSSAASLAQAQDILVRERIPHHTLIQVWWNASAVVQILIVVAGIALVRKSRLLIIMLVCAGSVLVLSAVQVLTGNQALALIFPWRPSVFLVPLGTTFVIAYAVEQAWRRWDLAATPQGRSRDLLGRAAISLVVILALAGLVKFRNDQSQIAADPAREVMAFVRESSTAGEVFMIPPQLQDFRLSAAVPVLVDFKSIPYRADEVIQWYDRLQLARLFYRDQAAGVSCRALRDAAKRYAVTHVVLARAQFGAACGPWIERYQDADFAVYELIPQ
jgi:hypothetical protein